MRPPTRLDERSREIADAARLAPTGVPSYRHSCRVVGTTRVHTLQTEMAAWERVSLATDFD